MRETIFNYFQLTKSTIMLLILFTGAAALVLGGSLVMQPERFMLVVVGLYLTGGSANALNQSFKRDVDVRMKRTCRKRPLPPRYKLDEPQWAGYVSH